MESRILGSMVSPDVLVEWTQRFVRSPSPQTDLFEAEPLVQGFIRNDVAPVLNQLGLPIRYDAMGNLISEIGDGDGPTLLLLAYAMTHPASSMTEPYAGEIVTVDGRAAIRGRGVSEQKASLAAAIAAAAAAQRVGSVKGRLILAVSTAGETGRHDAARSILQSLEQPPDAAVIVIGTTGRASLANKGRIDVLVKVKGRAAHSSTPWRGVDAISGARQVMARLDRLDVGVREHPGLGRATLTVTSILSRPRATHTVQSEVDLVLDRRLLPGDSPDDAFEELRKVLAPDAGSCTVHPALGPVMYPSEVAVDGPLMRSIAESHVLAGLSPPQHFFSHGCLDAGLFAQNGIEATMWGPGDMDQWHSDNEMVLLDDLLAGARGYAVLTERYLR